MPGDAVSGSESEEDDDVAVDDAVQRQHAQKFRDQHDHAPEREKKHLESVEALASAIRTDGGDGVEGGASAAVDTSPFFAGTTKPPSLVH